MSDVHTNDCGYTVTGKVCNCSCGVANEVVPSEHIPGSGCLCGASSSFECWCEIVDWRSRREVELEAENKKLRKVVEAAKTELKIIYDYAQVGNSTNCGIQTIAANLGEVEKHAYRAITELEQIECNNKNLKQG